MSTTNDRMASGYVPNFDIDAEVGRQGELVVASVVDAIRDGASMEIKTDERALTTRRIYLEEECRTIKGWSPSGIDLTSAELWATVLAGDIVVVAPTWRYRSAQKWARNHRLVVDCKRGSHPTRGVVVPLERLLTLLMEAK